MVAYTSREALMAGARPVANAFALANRMAGAYTGMFPLLRGYTNTFNANATLLERSVAEYGKPDWNIDHTYVGKEKIDLPLNHTMIDGQKVLVSIKPVLEKPFGDLIHFERDPKSVAHRNDPKVLVIGPMSGHYLTLLRGTFTEHLPHSDLYGTDWHNARDVPAGEPFDQDSQIAYIKEYLEFLGPNTHVIAVCQPCGPTMTAISQLAAENSPNQPLSMTYVAGPVDTGAAPSEVSEFPFHPMFSPFVNAATSTVPIQFEGAGRRVHMGQAQLFGFMLPKMQTHTEKQLKAWLNEALGNDEAAELSHRFYDEYLAVMDLPAEYIQQHCNRTFINRDLANGTLVVDGKLIDPSNIKKTAIYIVEGGKDDISTPGQTEAALEICSGVPQHQRYYHLEPGVGHYGSFEGSGYRAGIAPRQAAFIRKIGEEAGLHYSQMPTERTLIEPTRHQWARQKQGLAPEATAA